MAMLPVVLGSGLPVEAGNSTRTLRGSVNVGVMLRFTKCEAGKRHGDLEEVRGSSPPGAGPNMIRVEFLLDYSVLGDLLSYR